MQLPFVLSKKYTALHSYVLVIMNQPLLLVTPSTEQNDMQLLC